MVKMTTANIMHSKRCSASKSEHICGNLKKKQKKYSCFTLDCQQERSRYLSCLVWSGTATRLKF